MSSVKAVIFDLDGTLLDTAPDLAAALNILLAKHQRQDVPFEHIRPVASHGSKAMVKLGFNIDESDSNFAALRQEYLHVYSEHCCNFTTLFDGMNEVLNQLAAKQIPWGIVTNKPGWLTMPILKNLNLIDKTNCVVCGDSLPKTKPDPAPLFYACELLNCLPSECIYIGDAEFDVIAGNRAGIKTIVAGYGYITDEEKAHHWGATDIIQAPGEILKFI